MENNLEHSGKSKIEDSEKPVLLTGGAGFIGSYLTEYLQQLNIPVLVLDNLSTGMLTNLSSSVIETSFVLGDVADYSLVRNIVKNCSMVIHLASVVGMKAVLNNPLGVVETNINATKVLVEECSRNGIPFIFFSTSAVYGDINNSSINKKETDLVHTFGFHPISLYVEAKKIAETICEVFRKNYGLKYLIVRPFNIIGPRQTSAYGMVVPTFVRAALKGEYLPIHGDGKQSRTFSDVRLAVKLLWSLIKNQDSYNQIFNLATTTQEISIIELALMVCRLAKVNAKYNFIPYEIDFDKNFIDIKTRSPHLDKLKAYTEKWDYTNLEDTLLDIIESERQKLSVKKTPCLQEGYNANKV